MIAPKKISDSLLANAIEFMAGFGLMALVTILFSVEVAGRWMWLMAIAAVHSKIREGITQAALFRFGYSGPQQDQRAVRKLLLLATLAFEMLALLASLFMGLVAMPELAEWWLVYPFFTFGTALLRFRLFAAQASMNTRVQLKIQIASLCATAVATACTLGGQLTLPAFTALLGTFRLLAIWPFTRAGAVRYLLFVQIKATHWQQVKTYLRSGLLRETTGSVASRAELLMGGLLLAFSEVAWLGLGARYAQLLLLPNAALQSLVYARLCQLQQKAEVVRLAGSTLLLLWGSFGLAALFMLLTGHLWLPLVHGPEYAAALPVVAIMMSQVAIFSPAGGIFGSLANCWHRPGLTTRLVLAGSVFKLSLAVPAIYYLGLWGALGLSILTEVMGMVVANYMLQRNFGTGWAQLAKAGYAQLGATLRQYNGSSVLQLVTRKK